MEDSDTDAVMAPDQPPYPIIARPFRTGARSVGALQRPREAPMGPPPLPRSTLTERPASLPPQIPTPRMSTEQQRPQAPAAPFLEEDQLEEEADAQTLPPTDPLREMVQQEPEASAAQ